MTAQRYTFTATLCWGGDIQTGEAEVTVTYGVDWGAPAQGPSYASGGQPADPDEIIDTEVVEVDGQPWGPMINPYNYGGRTLAEAADTLIDKLVDENWDDMIEHAIETDASLETMRPLFGALDG